MNPNGDPAKSFTVPLSKAHTADVKIFVLPLKARNLELTPWPSTTVLASILHRLDDPFAALPEDENANDTTVQILELGAGIGLCGLTASMIWKRQATLTDLAPIVPGLAHNIVLNHALLSQHGGSAIAGALDWDAPDTLTRNDGAEIPNTTKAHVIMAADVVYDEDHPAMLTKAILAWLAPGPHSRAILTLAQRVAYLDYLRDLWQRLDDGGLVCLQEGAQRAEGESWDDETLCEWSVWGWKKATT